MALVLVLSMQMVEMPLELRPWLLGAWTFD